MKTIREINHGGFGVVHEVLTDDGHSFARKTFRPSPAVKNEAEQIEKSKGRFIRETRIQSLINHPHIMPILESALEDDPPHFLMPLAQEDYAAKVARDKANRTIDLEPLLNTLAGLEELHRLGYVHRDLKPQNILHLNDKWVISDLGLVLPLVRNTTMITGTQSAWGTIAYAAPEISVNFRNVPPQSDIYSFGCILHDLVGSNLRVPFSKITAEGTLGAIIEKCTEFDPTQRFPDIASLRSALVAALSSPLLTVGGQQINEWVELLKTDTPNLELTFWEEAIRFIELNFESDEAKVLMQAIDIPQLEDIFNKSVFMFHRLALLLCKWIKNSAFDFAYCDVLGARLMKIYQLGDTADKAAATVAAFNMSYRHNRWLVMGYFVRMAGSSIEEDLADRLAMEFYAASEDGLFKMSRIEDAIQVSKASLHPKIANAFAVVEDRRNRNAKNVP